MRSPSDHRLAPRLQRIAVRSAAVVPLARTAMVRGELPGAHTTPTPATRAMGTVSATVVRAGEATTTRCLRGAQDHAVTAAGVTAGVANCQSK